MQTRGHLKNFSRENYVHDQETLDCSLGINPFGVSKLVMYACLDPRDAQNYPPADAKELREELAKHWSDIALLKSENFAISCGSVCVLEKLNKIFIDPKDKAYGYAPQFVDFKSDLESQGGIYEFYCLDKSKNLKFNVDEFIKGIKPEHKIIYIDNPNNPTGQIISIAYIIKVADIAKNNNSCLIVDEAYGDFMNRHNSAISLIDNYPNICVVRTFSKGFALAGLRIGYAAANKGFLKNYISVNLPFMANIFGLQLAVIALSDLEHIKQSCKKIELAKKKIMDKLNIIEVAETHNKVPIMLLKCEKSKNLFDNFAKYGIIVTPCNSFDSLDTSYVRIRVPGNNLNMLLDAIEQIEKIYS